LLGLSVHPVLRLVIVLGHDRAAAELGAAHQAQRATGVARDGLDAREGAVVGAAAQATVRKLHRAAGAWREAVMVAAAQALAAACATTDQVVLLGPIDGQLFGSGVLLAVTVAVVVQSSEGHATSELGADVAARQKRASVARDGVEAVIAGAIVKVAAAAEALLHLGGAEGDRLDAVVVLAAAAAAEHKFLLA